MDTIHKKILCNNYLKYNGPLGSQEKIYKSSLQNNQSIDWYGAGLVRPVKDQGNCGSCWAFSAVGAIESMIDFNAGKKVELSEQQLIDCSKENMGCNGGWMHKAFEYVIDSKGISLSVNYPYKGAQNQKCLDKPKVKESSLFHHVFVKQFSVDALKSALFINPVSVAVDADFDFVFYKEGIFDKKVSPRPNINHAILLIGFDANKNIWTIKNSWGRHWGQEGFMDIAVKDGPGVAGINCYGVLPIFDPTKN